MKLWGSSDLLSKLSGNFPGCRYFVLLTPYKNFSSPKYQLFLMNLYHFRNNVRRGWDDSHRGTSWILKELGPGRQTVFLRLVHILFAEWNQNMPLIRLDSMRHIYIRKVRNGNTKMGRESVITRFSYTRIRILYLSRGSVRRGWDDSCKCTFWIQNFSKLLSIRRMKHAA